MERTIGIENLEDYSTPINPTDLFGKDTRALSRACMKVMHNWLYPYEDCYVSTDKPNFHDAFLIKSNEASNRTIGEIYDSLVNEWYAENPDEKQKEIMSRKLWEEQSEKQFRIIYGIAKRHHIRLEWCGHGSCPQGDRWNILKKGERIGKIHCM